MNMWTRRLCLISWTFDWKYGIENKIILIWSDANLGHNILNHMEMYCYLISHYSIKINKLRLDRVHAGRGNMCR